MASRILRQSKRLGFTLVELLIVVAIIGVLSTIAIPTFKRLVQKSKKAEAKVQLGGVFVAEQGFSGEYGVFGNYLAGIGFETTGTSFIYRVGFPDNSCVSSLVAPDGNTAGAPANMKATNGGYYTGFTSA